MLFRSGLLDTWLLGPDNVHSIAGTSPFKNLSQRGLLDTWLLGLGNVHSVIRTRIETLGHLVIGSGPNSPVQDTNFCNFVTR